ncbi:UDP-N-acetylmuramoyl-tripeptide--D-alanyl-D-alanine ligase [Kocuria rhizophila]|nr:UDP-N-acetylmuramoyl-tripeptide--D-alanyl-D-alanine ligase [Kocuria rhizophila]
MPQAAAAGAVLHLTEREVLDGVAGSPYPCVRVVRAWSWPWARWRAAWCSCCGPSARSRSWPSRGRWARPPPRTCSRIFGAEGPAVAPRRLRDGRGGCPLTVFTATEDTKYLVMMGAAHIGNIRYLLRHGAPRTWARCYPVRLRARGGVRRSQTSTAPRARWSRPSPEGAPCSTTTTPTYRPCTSAPRRASCPSERTEPRDPAHPDPRVWAEDVAAGADGCPILRAALPDGSPSRSAAQLIGVHHVDNLLAAASVACARPGGARASPPGWRAGAPRGGAVERTEQAGRRDRGQRRLTTPTRQSMKAALQTLARLGRGDAERPPRHRGHRRDARARSVRRRPRGPRATARASQHLARGRRGSARRPVFTAGDAEGSWGEEAAWVPDAEAAPGAP